LGITLKSKIICVLLNPTYDKIIKIDNFQPGGTYKVEEVFEFPVGKAISVALTIKTMGNNPIVIALIGKDEGSIYHKFLTKNQIEHQITSIDGKTRSNITILDEMRNLSTHIRFPGFNVSNEELDKLKYDLMSYIQTGDYVIFSGSLPGGVPADYFIKISAILQKKGVKVVIDTSGDPLKTILKCKPFLIKSNLEEMSTILGENLIESQELAENPNKSTLIELSKKCEPLLKFGPEYIILTLGKYGSILISNKEILYASVFLESAPYTVGSGDAFLGGFLYGVIEQKNTLDCLKYATACGAANTQKLGAGILDKETVNELLPNVRTEQLR
jgi:1-phosphofructokinase family hexose kinase